MFELDNYRAKSVWVPFFNIESVRSEISKLFDDLFTPVLPKQYSSDYWYPAVDIHEDKDKYVLKAEVSGMKQDDIRLSIEENTLTISGKRAEKSETKEDQYHQLERSCGNFCRAFQLPPNLKLDKISASYKAGILEIVLPKGVKSTPKQIQIKVK